MSAQPSPLKSATRLDGPFPSLAQFRRARDRLRQAVEGVHQPTPVRSLEQDIGAAVAIEVAGSHELVRKIGAQVQRARAGDRLGVEQVDQPASVDDVAQEQIVLAVAVEVAARGDLKVGVPGDVDGAFRSDLRARQRRYLPAPLLAASRTSQHHVGLAIAVEIGPRDGFEGSTPAQGHETLVGGDGRVVEGEPIREPPAVGGAAQQDRRLESACRSRDYMGLDDVLLPDRIGTRVVDQRNRVEGGPGVEDRRRGDRVDDYHPVAEHFAEHREAAVLRVQVLGIVGEVDEPPAGRAVGIAAKLRHGHRTAQVREVELVDDRWIGGYGHDAGGVGEGEAAALNDETGNAAMDERVCKVAVGYVPEEVGDRRRGDCLEELDLEIPQRRHHGDHRIPVGGAPRGCDGRELRSAVWRGQDRRRSLGCRRSRRPAQQHQQDGQ